MPLQQQIDDIQAATFRRQLQRRPRHTTMPLFYAFVFVCPRADVELRLPSSIISTQELEIYTFGLDDVRTQTRLISPQSSLDVR